MSFYTSLTGLNAATAQLSVTSNNIANVGTTGFKRSRVDFGDIFATSPLQKASSVIGQGVAIKSVSQEFSQGNLQFSANSLNLGISGDGFFLLKSADGLQDVYTRSGEFVLDQDYAVVNASKQTLMAAGVDDAGKADLSKLTKLIIPRATVGEARETTEVNLGLNLPANAEVINEVFNPQDSTTYNLTTGVTVFDESGNSYLATVYYVKTQNATTSDPTNKWQTHVYIGNTKLEERLIQATDNDGTKLFVNQYGQIQGFAAGTEPPVYEGTKLFYLDSLKDRINSTPATAQGDALPPPIITAWRTGVDLSTLANPPRFKVNIDGSSTPVEVDLSYLSSPGNVYTGSEIARELTNLLNKSYGDERYFDFSGYVSTDDADVSTVSLFKVAVANRNDLIGPALSAFDTVEFTLEEGEDAAKFTVAQAVARIQEAVSEIDSDITVGYDAVNKSFTFKHGSDTQAIHLISANGITDSLFSLGGTQYTTVNTETNLYGAYTIPNGGLIRSVDDQRYGIRVNFDDTGFSISSGTTGDKSSVAIYDGNEEALSQFGFSRATAAEDGNFVAVSSVPERGIASDPAVLSGNSIGVNLNNKFRVDGTNNSFVVTVDNVSGVVSVPPKDDYTIDSFTEELERRINALADAQGRTVSGVTVRVARNALGQSYFEFTSGTTGSNSFIRVSGDSVWGLSGIGSARGSTSLWVQNLDSLQATNAGNSLLYISAEDDVNFLESTEAGEAISDWVPVFLDKGELTFDSRGNLASPLTATSLVQPSGSQFNLEFSINYNGSTQYASSCSILAQDQNGRPEGDLIGLDIGNDGLVTASYSNGSLNKLAKIVLANFTAPTGLRQIGDSNYVASAQSGLRTLGEASSAGFGTIRAGATERANVDLTQELIELITAQRNFQANAKAIETSNSLTQTIINIRA